MSKKDETSVPGAAESSPGNDDALREIDERYRFLAENIPVQVWTAMPNGNLDYVTEQTAQHLGQTPEKLLAEGWQNVVHPDDLPIAIERWMHALATGVTYEVEFRLKLANGEYAWHLARAIPQRNAAGEIVRWFGTNTDVEERREQQRRLDRAHEAILVRERKARLEAEAARAQAESANRMKDEFLSTVSHELRTPLNAMLGWAAMLQTGTLDADSRARAIETIERNARAQGRLIEDLLDLSRILQGKFRLAVGPVELVRIVEAALDSVGPSAEAKGVRLQPILDSHASIVGDGERLQQIVWNLLSNAIKFTPKGGRVQVTLKRTETSVELGIADTGVGIAPEFLPHVFEPFRQGDAGITRRSGGLGLGLSIVRSLVELHGGTVSASSDGVGFGASFSVRLPMEPLHVDNPPPPASPAGKVQRPAFECPDALAGLRVLVVDDEKDTRELLTFLLTECKAVVTSAASTAEAFTRLELQPFDALLSDIGMPGEDGLTFLKRVRQLPPEKNGRVPAVALTAYARTEDHAAAMGAGFDMHLGKPIEPSELLLVVASLVQKRS